MDQKQFLEEKRAVDISIGKAEVERIRAITRDILAEARLREAQAAEIEKRTKKR